MALNIGVTYANTTPADADYPYGSAKNETTPGALDGTPLEKAIYDDLLGLMQSFLAVDGAVPNGNPDTVNVPQYLQSIMNSRWYDKLDYAVGTKTVGSDGLTYVCIGVNGPTTTVQDPVTESSPRTKWITEASSIFDALNPVGSFYMSIDPESPADKFGVGTWDRVLGRFLVGLDEANSLWDVPGEQGGSTSHSHNNTLSVADHALTIAEMPAHTHNFTQENTRGSGAAGAANGNSSFFTDVTQSTGGNAGHNHGINGSISSQTTVPPYYTTYIWRRTA